jgi:RimJ/RimL family protein N-acetyltransferase
MELRADGIVLRPWREDDLAALTAACQDAEIARWLPMVPSPYSEDDGRRYLEQARLNWELGDAYNFAVVDESDHLLGSIAIRILRFGVGHIGYWIAAEARGRGIATQALETLCRWAVDELRLGRLELAADPENHASQRVAEKAGFQREGVMRSALEYRDGSRRDSVFFSLLPDELRRA